MADGDALTREQALLLLHDHLGEYVRFMLRVRTDARDGLDPGDHFVIELSGELTHPVEASEDLAAAALPAATTETFGYLYKVGEQPVALPPFPGAIRESASGINFELCDGLVLRIAWRDPGASRGGA